MSLAWSRGTIDDEHCVFGMVERGHSCRACAHQHPEWTSQTRTALEPDDDIAVGEYGPSIISEKINLCAGPDGVLCTAGRVHKSGHTYPFPRFSECCVTFADTFKCVLGEPIISFEIVRLCVDPAHNPTPSLNCKGCELALLYV